MAQLWAEKGLDTTVNNALHAPMFIGTLNDDVLLIIFDFCRMAAEEEFEDVSSDLDRNWKLNRSRWWYKLTQICQGWRSLILASPSHLKLHIVCTKGTPVEDMLAHFPIYHSKSTIPSEEEKRNNVTMNRTCSFPSNAAIRCSVFTSTHRILSCKECSSF